jgi:hypothetical protein
MLCSDAFVVFTEEGRKGTLQQKDKRVIFIALMRTNKHDFLVVPIAMAALGS